MIESLFEIGGVEIRRYLVEHVAGNYWNFVLAETEKVVEVMGANEELARGVFGLLSGVDVEVKMEGKGEEEEPLIEDKVGAKVEETGGGGELGEIDHERETGQSTDGPMFDKVDRNARCDSATLEEDVPPANPVANIDSDAGFHDDKDNGEGLTQAEKDMLRMALRPSDGQEESTNEGLGYAGENEEKTTEEEDWVQLVKKQSEIFEAF